MIKHRYANIVALFAVLSLRAALRCKATIGPFIPVEGVSNPLVKPLTQTIFFFPNIFLLLDRETIDAIRITESVTFFRITGFTHSIIRIPKNNPMAASPPSLIKIPLSIIFKFFPENMAITAVISDMVRLRKTSVVKSILLISNSVVATAKPKPTTP